MKAKTLYEDQAGRWIKGEIGKILENDYPEKYDYLVSFVPEAGPKDIADDDAPFLKRLAGAKIRREYYFYDYEVEIILEEGEE